MNINIFFVKNVKLIARVKLEKYVVNIYIFSIVINKLNY